MKVKKYIPESMKTLDNWVLWKLEEQTNDRGETRKAKIPIQAVSKKNAMSTEPKTWCSYKTAVENKGNYGIGFVLPLDGTMTMIDLDHCIENNTLTPFAESVVERFYDTYMELSQSGTGIHIFVKGGVPQSVKTAEIEIYSSKRYCAMTGNSIRAVEVANYQEELDRLYLEFHKETPQPKEHTTQTSNLDVSEILELIRNSRNGAKFNTYFAGLVEKNSENTLGLATMLAFYCRNDRAKIEQIMRMSGLAREKFNSRRVDKTWLDTVIDKAIESTQTVYEPNKSVMQSPTHYTEPRELKEMAKQLDEETYSMRFKTFADIKAEKTEDIVYIKSGIYSLDNGIGGFALGEVSVWSGVNGSGKSQFLLQECLEYASQNTKVMLFSGEMKDSTIKNLACKICVGKNGLKQYENSWTFKDKSILEIASAWISKYLLLYDNEYTNEAGEIIQAIRYAVSKGCKVIILDNLMMLNLRQLDRDKYEAQSMFANQLASLAKELNIHIHIVMHPRKVAGFLRKEDISGSADLTNAVDNVFIIHRVTKDFQNRVSEFDKALAGGLSMFDNVIEVCKNRRNGYLGFVGLYFHPEARSFSEDKRQEARYFYGTKY